MPSMAKIAKKLGLTEEQAAEALKQALGQSNNVDKVAQLLGIARDDAQTLLALKIAGDDVGFRAYAAQINIVDQLRGSGLM